MIKTVSATPKPSSATLSASFANQRGKTIFPHVSRTLSANPVDATMLPANVKINSTMERWGVQPIQIASRINVPKPPDLPVFVMVPENSVTAEMTGALPIFSATTFTIRTFVVQRWATVSSPVPRTVSAHRDGALIRPASVKPRRTEDNIAFPKKNVNPTDADGVDAHK